MALLLRVVEVVNSALQVLLEVTVILEHGAIVVAWVGGQRVLEPGRAIEWLLIEIKLFLIVHLVIDGDVLVVPRILMNRLVKLVNGLTWHRPWLH